MKYTYNKLVRDKIPESINNQKGKNCKYIVLDDDKYIEELNRKILEEANEFVENNDIEELGDLMEVLRAIMKIKHYDIKQVESIMENKRIKKGGFENKIYLEYVEED